MKISYLLRTLRKRTLTPLFQLSASIALFASGGMVAEDVHALLITKTKICDAATEDCAGNPETDTYKVTLDRTQGSDTSFNISWLVPAGMGSLPLDLTGSSTWTVNLFTANEIVLAIDTSNDTVLADAINTNAAILSFGFGVDPNSTASSTSAGNVFDMVGTGQGGQQQFPGGFKQIDVCLFAAGCTGGNVNDGLQASNDPDVGTTQYSMDSLVVTLTPDAGTYGNTADLLFFPTKWQSTWGSFEPGGAPGGNGGPPQQVPEPAILALLGMGLASLGFSRRSVRR